MLGTILDWTGLDERSCARLLRVSEDEFGSWLREEQPTPKFLDKPLANLCGVDVSTIRNLRCGDQSIPVGRPGILLLKIQAESELTRDDRSTIAALRQLGQYEIQLDADLKLTSSSDWTAFRDSLISNLARSVSTSAEQGQSAAFNLRRVWGVDEHESISEILRERLRRSGLLFFEAAVPNSKLRGACFKVTRGAESRPCVFVNTHGTNWWRRTEVLLHELCHALFDVETENATFDFTTKNDDEVAMEQRADSFAAYAMLPAAALEHASNQLGIQWPELNGDDIARLIDKTGADHAVIFDRALQLGKITPAQRREFGRKRFMSELKKISRHALSRDEFLAQSRESAEDNFIQTRHTTTLAPNKISLPPGYVKLVIQAVNNMLISPAKASEMLFVSTDEFARKYAQYSNQPLPGH